ncbi:hypothetical protein K505DRAFT_378288 [Melanomma pulvis-pyrius CBS 109.77]|uniref:Uncharacterized protein n=1 Tax=Melanomma pulvis-pyrius CBS 109.77 TaxID=1314802 RepID=A0A6A6WZI4_9PLEO|nr:hypothetical protein K505DRAFT_378288 [Melanomma pulvis-pyrius CBS 109.77]
MSSHENDTGKEAGSSWTDRERLVYLVALMETSSPKLDFNNTPRPAGRSLIACQRMVTRLKTTVKADLEALRAGQPVAAAANGDAAQGKKNSKKPRTPKRKNKANSEDVQDTSPKKRGRKADAEPTVKEESDENGGWVIVDN